jgi:hypothetical protein
MMSRTLGSGSPFSWTMTWGEENRRCSAKFKMTAFAKFKLSASPVGWFESLGEEDSMDTIGGALKKRP